MWISNLSQKDILNYGMKEDEFDPGQKRLRGGFYSLIVLRLALTPSFQPPVK